MIVALVVLGLLGLLVLVWYVSRSRNYWTIDQNVEVIDEPYRSICKRILADHRPLFEIARGSTHNHQTWIGGYIDHVNDGMNYLRHLYVFDSSFGRPLAFSMADAMLIFFIHDLEKPWKIQVDEQGNVTNREDLTTKEDFRRFRDEMLASYGLDLTPALQNALRYIEGEGSDYTSNGRTMNELAAFCHKVDVHCARVWHDYPKAEDDEWRGAGRFRTIDI